MKYRKTRPGSVLILVVAVLVVLALMATAFITTTRLDRQQGSPTLAPALLGGAATPISDQKLQAASDAVVAGVLKTLRDDVYDLSAIPDPVTHILYSFRPLTANPANTYRNWDAFASVTPQRIFYDDPWLASRAPTMCLIGGNKVYCWPKISRELPVLNTDPADPLIGVEPIYVKPDNGASAPAGPLLFRPDPKNPGAAVLSDNEIYNPNIPNPQDLPNKLQISTVSITYPGTFVSPPALGSDDGTGSGRTRMFPAFHDAPNRISFIAGDADGDGFADSVLVRLRQSSRDVISYAADGRSHEVTYWAGVRIIDNNSAINLNTALSRDRDFGFAVNDLANRGTGMPNTGNERPNYGFFRSNIGLDELLPAVIPARPNNIRETDSVLAYRLGLTYLTSGRYKAAMTPRYDNGSPSSDFTFTSKGDLLEMQLARRLTNPGLYGKRPTDSEPGMPARMHAFDVNEAANLAYHYSLISPDLNRSEIETTLGIALWNNVPNLAVEPAKMFRYYATDLNGIGSWYARNFDTVRMDYTPRVLLTADNPVGNGMVVHPMNALPAWVNANFPVVTEAQFPWAVISKMPDYGADLTRIAKACVNTAPFAELWRAYWNVMCNDQNPAAPAIGNIAMFRSSMRPPSTTSTTDWTTGWPTGPVSNQMLLRSALAAINTIQLRSRIENNPLKMIAARQIQFQAGNKPVTISVYGVDAQPYITEVYATNDATSGNKPNPKGYLAIELYNPFPTPIKLEAENWRIALVDRSNSPLQITDEILITDPNEKPTDPNRALVEIPANDYIVLENYDPTGGDPDAALTRPKAVNSKPINGRTVDLSALEKKSGTTPKKVFFIKGLDKGMGKELVIFRPVDPARSVPATYSVKDAITQQKPGFAPVDSYDFTDFPAATTGDSANATAWHYVRPSGSQHPWQFVYPGSYNTGGASSTPRFAGTQTDTYKVEKDKDDTYTEFKTYPVQLAAADNVATYTNTFTIQMAAAGFPGPMKDPYTGKMGFPFGGFARDGDILQVTFIGSYVVRDGADPTKILEIMPVTLDSFFGDVDNANDNGRQIGRFCPGLITPDNYAWASRLFDYVTAIHNPNSDTLPQVPAGLPISGVMPVSNAGQAANVNEDGVPIEGLVNINTAPVEVLAMLPWLNYQNITPNQLDNKKVQVAQSADPRRAAADAVSRKIAEAIVRDRMLNGPFRSIFDLNRVYIGDDYDASNKVTIRRCLGDAWFYYKTRTNVAAAVDATRNDGDIAVPTATAGGAPLPADKDGITGDFKEKYLVINRVSNLVTTRSDSFTCYIVVQAWQDAGTRYPVLLGEKRTAFIVDRSGLNQINNTIDKMRVLPVPTK